MWFRRQTRGGISSQELRQLAEQGRARAAETEAALTRGQLPGSVRDRIQQQVAGDLPWTSDLSVNEWALLSRLQVRPLGLVMGSCFYHVAYSVSSTAGAWYSTDLSVQERALYEGRRLALTRLLQEAQAYGAHAVVGVELNMRQPGFQGHETEFVAIGTAVQFPGLAVPKEPVLCTVSAQELALLLKEGTLPIGIAMGVCVHYQYTSRQDMWQMQSWYNQEIPTYTDAVYHTRNKAVRNMWSEAKAMGASGVLAHTTSLNVREVEVERGEGDEREDHVVEFFSIGTAIATTRVPSPIRTASILDLRD